MTPTASPSETSDIPEAARKQTPAGAEAFLEYYMLQVNVAWTEPDASAIDRLGTAECQFCNRTVEAAEYFVANDERYKSDPVTVLSVENFGGAPSGEQYVALSYRQNAADIIDAEGKVLRSDPQADVKGNAAVKWTADGWRLRGIEDAG